MNASDSFQLSIVIPVKDEVDSIPLLAGEIEQLFDARKLNWECIWVDDGSSDNSVHVIKQLHERNPRHRYVILDSNYGQSAALFAGFRQAKGDVIATLDGDLQNDPADLLPMLEKLERGKIDLVNGVRGRRPEDRVRLLASRVGNWLMNWMIGIRVSDVGCSTRVFYREFLEGIPLWKGTHRFLAALLIMNGARAIELPVTPRARKFGKGKYGINNRLWVTLADMLAVRWYKWRRVFPITSERSN